MARGLKRLVPISWPALKLLGNTGNRKTVNRERAPVRRGGRGPGGQGEGYHLDDLVAELLQDDDDPDRCVIVLRGGPDEADGVQHLGDEGGELGGDGPRHAGGDRPLRLIPASQPSPSHGCHWASRRGSPRRRGEATP